ncbi:hypothetical protein [Klebsiella pneumoniae IS39]|nr:hypothetical protein [Klebsiella pneumoniae IS39]
MNYGLVSKQDARLYAEAVCDVIGHGKANAAVLLCVETAAAETLLGDYKDPTPTSAGTGLTQVDLGTFEWLRDKYKNSRYAPVLLNQFGIDLSRTVYEELRTSPLMAMLFCRLRYLTVSESIPATREARAATGKNITTPRQAKARRRITSINASALALMRYSRSEARGVIMNSLKRMAKAWLLMNGAFVLLVMATQPAMANESQSLGLDLDSILRALPAGWASGVTAVFIVLYAVAQLRAVLPPSVTKRIPTVVMKILDLVAANYAHARNADAISKVARDAGKAKGPSDVDYRVMVETAKNNGELRGSRIESAGDYPGDDRPGSKSPQ